MYKVVLVSPYPFPGRSISGGVERVTDTLLPHLGKLVDLSLIVPQAQENKALQNGSVRIFYLKRARGVGVLNYWRSEARTIAELVDRLEPDLVHLQGVAGWGRYISCPRLLTIHGIAHRDILTGKRGRRWGAVAAFVAANLVRFIEYSGRKNIGNVVLINKYVETVFSDLSVLRKFSIPNPVDSRFFHDLPDLKAVRKKKILVIGKVGSRKNTLEAVRIASQIMARDLDVRVTICGDLNDASYVRECRSAAAQFGVGERFEWAGNIETETLIRHLDDSCVVLMTSQQETAPMAIAEANARGVPVVAPELFGIPHMLHHGKNGLFLFGRSDAEKAEILRQAIEMLWDREAIANDALDLYEPSRVALETVNAYTEVLAKG